MKRILLTFSLVLLFNSNANAQEGYWSRISHGFSQSMLTAGDKFYQYSNSIGNSLSNAVGYVGQKGTDLASTVQSSMPSIQNVKDFGAKVAGSAVSLKNSTTQAFSNAVKAVSLAMIAKKASIPTMVAGVSLMQYAFYKKVSFNKEKLYNDLMKDKVETKTYIHGNGHRIKIIYTPGNKEQTKKQVKLAESDNTKKSILLGLVGAGLATAGYMAS